VAEQRIAISGDTIALLEIHAVKKNDDALESL